MNKNKIGLLIISIILLSMFSISVFAQTNSLSSFEKTINGVSIKVLGSEYSIAKMNRSAYLLINDFTGGLYRTMLQVERPKNYNNHNLNLQNVGSSGAILINVDGLTETINGPLPTERLSQPVNSQYKKVIGNLEITVLSSEYSVNKVDRAATLVFDGTDKVHLSVGQLTSFRGANSIRLENVGSGGAVLVTVDGLLDTINGPASIPMGEESTEGTQSYIKVINGLEIKVLGTEYAVAKENRSANLLIGGTNGEKIVLRVDQRFTYSDKTITLQNVGSSGAVLIDVNGVVETINGPASTNSGQIETDSGHNQGTEVKPNIKDIINLDGSSSDGDLSNLPEPFVSKEGVYNDNTVIVVGSRSDVQDVLGAGDITAKLQVLAKKNSKVTVNVLKDTELSDLGSKNIIALSSLDNNNNCVNTIVEKFISCNSLNLNPGEAIFKFVSQNNKQSLMIVGKTSMDVRLASKVFSEFENYRLHGNAVKIIGSLSTENIPYQQPQERNRRAENLPISTPPTSTPIGPNGECSGCGVDNRCLQYGTRFVRNEKPVYCDFDTDIRTQKQNRESCQNNYECLSNSCGNGLCQDINERIQGIEQELKEQRSLLQKILDFFSRLFGKGE